MISPILSRMECCKKLGISNNSCLIFAVHPAWSGWLLLDSENKRLFNPGHNTQGRFEVKDNLFKMYWDACGPDDFVFADSFFVHVSLKEQYSRNEMERFAAERLDAEPWRKKTDYDWAKQQIIQARLEQACDAIFGFKVFIAERARVFTDWLRADDESWIASDALIRGAVAIGKRSGINFGAVIAGQVHIGSDSHIASGAAIYGFNHNFKRTDIPMSQQGLTSKGIIIRDDVWIGANVVIVDGVTVNSHSVVAAGAVVTKDVPAFHVVAGVPAKVLYDKRTPS